MKLYPANLFEKLGFDTIIESVSGLTRSEMGWEEVQAFQPVSNSAFIEGELNRTSDMMRLLSSGEEVPFNHPHDVREAARKSRVERAILDGERMHKIKQFCATCRILKQFIKSREETYPYLSELSTGFIPLKELEDTIDRVISEHGSVKDNASPELRQIRNSLNARRNELRSSMEKIMRRATKDGYLTETEATIRNGRMVLAVKAEHKRKMSGFIQDVSSTGQTVYMEPTEALHINNDIRELERREHREVEKILMQLTAQIGSFNDFIQQNSVAAGYFDALMARASFCRNLDAEIPEINTVGHLEIHDGRNPILLLKQKNLPKDKREPIVPLNLTLDSHEKGLIVTGPNAGGKSVTLKTIGIFQLLVQSGFAIPANAASKIPIFSGVFLDMGDEQSIDNDLSTFSSRLVWTRDTLDEADSNSLVLVDEAGTGTDPEEGVALFQAFLEALNEKGCQVIATTHHGNLKVFAHNHPRFVNASMEFNQTTLSPTYVFKKGAPGSSYAFEIAERTGVASGVLKRARDLIGSSKNKLESLILDMENRAQEASSLRNKLAAEERKLEKIQKEYDQRLSTLKTERDKLREKALQEASAVMKSANSRIEEAIRQIIESKGDKKKIKEIREGVEKHKSQVDKELGKVSSRRKQKQKKYSEPPKVGDPVLLLDSNSAGELVEIMGNNAVVLMNGLRVKTKFKNLAKTDKPKEDKKTGYQLSSYGDDDGIITKSVAPSLDIRGFRGEDAVIRVNEYLDKVSTTHLKQVEIIHGKGDGILKKLVHEQLAKRKEVQKFDLAPWEQGGPGCTKIQMK